MASKDIICKACFKKAELLYHKNNYMILTSKDILKQKGWIVNFKNLKKSLCPDCNLFGEGDNMLLTKKRKPNVKT